MQDSRAAVGDKLLQLGQVNLTVRGLGLGQRTHVQSDDVFGQHLAGRGDPGSAGRPSQARVPTQVEQAERELAGL